MAKRQILATLIKDLTIHIKDQKLFILCTIVWSLKLHFVPFGLGKILNVKILSFDAAWL